MHPTTPVMTLPRELRPYLDLLNQVFEVDKKAGALTESNSIQRNVRNMRAWFEREIMVSQDRQTQVCSFTFHNPIGESYDETRSDCDASIAGSGTEQLVITEVMKPIVWLSVGGRPKYIIQQAVVVVESSRLVAAQQSVNEKLTTSSEGTAPVGVGGTYSFDGQVLAEALDSAAGPNKTSDAAADASPITDAASNTNSTQTPA